MTDELGADQCIDIPTPSVLGIAAGAVYPDKAAAVLHIGFKRGALIRRQHIAAGVVPDNRLESPQLLCVKDRGVIGRNRGPSAAPTNIDQSDRRRLNCRIIAKAIGLGKDQDRGGIEMLGKHGRHSLVAIEADQYPVERWAYRDSRNDDQRQERRCRPQNDEL